MQPNFSPALRLNAKSFWSEDCRIAELHLCDLQSIKKARFDSAVLCVDDGILDSEASVTSSLLPGSWGLSVLPRSPIELEVLLGIERIVPDEAASYVLAGAHTVTLHLESFFNDHVVDIDALAICLEGIVLAGGVAGIAVYPTTCPKNTLRALAKLGMLHLLSRLTVIMGDAVLASTDFHRWRYIPSMEDKMHGIICTLSEIGDEANHIKTVALGEFNTYTISLAARNEVDEITILDIDKYRFRDDGYVGSTYDLSIAGDPFEVELYSRPNSSIAEAVHQDAMHRARAARRVTQYLHRQIDPRDNVSLPELF